MSFADSAPSDHARVQNTPIDRSFEYRRLTRNLKTLVAAHPKATDLGRDEVVEHLADEHGFDKFELSIHRVCIGTQIRTLICVPTNVAQQPARKAQLSLMRQAAGAVGHPVILVHERFVQRQPRLSNCRLIEQAVDVPVRAEDRLAILLHLIENGYSTIIECAGAIRNEAPISLILHLVADGVISIRTDKPVGPYTRVDLVEVGSA